MKARIIAPILMAAAVSACQGGYGGGDYSPVIDYRESEVYRKTGNDDATRAAMAADWKYCDSLHDQRGLATAADGVLPAVVGAGLGAAAGAIGGGGPATALGAALGGVASLGYTLPQANDNLQDITNQCMRAKGWPVVAR